MAKSAEPFRTAPNMAMEYPEELYAGNLRVYAFSPSGKLLASGSQDRTIRLWEPVTGKLIRVFEGHRDLVTRVAFLPDGKSIASASGDRSIRLWDIK